MLEPLRKLLLGVSLLREKTDQTLDLVLSFGERLSATIVAELVASCGAVTAAGVSSDVLRISQNLRGR